MDEEDSEDPAEPGRLPGAPAYIAGPMQHAAPSGMSSAAELLGPEAEGLFEIVGRATQVSFTPVGDVGRMDAALRRLLRRCGVTDDRVKMFIRQESSEGQPWHRTALVSLLATAVESGRCPVDRAKIEPTPEKSATLATLLAKDLQLIIEGSQCLPEEQRLTWEVLIAVFANNELTTNSRTVEEFVRRLVG